MGSFLVGTLTLLSLYQTLGMLQVIIHANQVQL